MKYRLHLNPNTFETYLCAWLTCGDWVCCKDESAPNFKLTKGKWYEVVKNEWETWGFGNNIGVVDDEGNECYPYVCLFDTMYCNIRCKEVINEYGEKKMKFGDVVEKTKEVAHKTEVIVVKEVKENDGLVGGVTGAVIGTMLIPIPVVGTALGGWIGYKLDKRMR